MTLLYPQKLALTAPTSGGSSVGIARSRTKATEFLLFKIKEVNTSIFFVNTTEIMFFKYSAVDNFYKRVKSA
jgi:hypothetical protein